MGSSPSPLALQSRLTWGRCTSLQRHLAMRSAERGPLPRLPNKLVHFPVLVPDTKPPRENAATMEGGVMLLSHSNSNSGDWASLVATHA